MFISKTILAQCYTSTVSSFYSPRTALFVNSSSTLYFCYENLLRFFEYSRIFIRFCITTVCVLRSSSYCFKLLNTSRSSDLIRENLSKYIFSNSLYQTKYTIFSKSDDANSGNNHILPERLDWWVTLWSWIWQTHIRDINRPWHYMGNYITCTFQHGNFQ